MIIGVILPFFNYVFFLYLFLDFFSYEEDEDMMNV